MSKAGASGLDPEAVHPLVMAAIGTLTVLDHEVRRPISIVPANSPL